MLLENGPFEGSDGAGMPNLVRNYNSFVCKQDMGNRNGLLVHKQSSSTVSDALTTVQ